MQSPVIANEYRPGYVLPIIAMAFTGGMFAFNLSIPSEDRTDKTNLAAALWGAGVLVSLVMFGATVVARG